MRELPTPTFPLGGLIDFKRRRSAPVVKPQVVVNVPVAVPQPQATALPGYQVAWARHEDEVREAQRLRYQVFANELGAQLGAADEASAGLDVDAFDAHCEHLLVRQLDEGGEPGTVVGTYRVLTPPAARRAGGYYSETEFDLHNLAPLREQMAELGRSCVHPDHRSGGVILALWAALARFMQDNSLSTMVGCASIGMRDGGHTAASLWTQLRQSHLAPDSLQVTPHLPLPVAELDCSLQVEAPPLIKGYLRCGAKVLGAPAWDPDFNTADLPVLLNLADLPARYRKHFLG